MTEPSTSQTSTAEPAELRELIRIAADWLDMAAEVIHKDRGYVLLVAECMKAADHARARASVPQGQVAQSARRSLGERL